MRTLKLLPNNQPSGTRLFYSLLSLSTNATYTMSAAKENTAPLRQATLLTTLGKGKGSKKRTLALANGGTRLDVYDALFSDIDAS